MDPRSRRGGLPVEIRSLLTGDSILRPLPAASQNRWQPEQPLERGRLYRWSVNVSQVPDQDNVPPASASLQVLSATNEEKLRHLRAALKVSHLALAVAYARLDPVTEARQEPETLSAQDPESALAAQLRESLKQCGCVYTPTMPSLR